MVRARLHGRMAHNSQACLPGMACDALRRANFNRGGICDFGTMRRVGAVRGYEENLYTGGWSRASTCWCKEKSSTVNRRSGPRFERSDLGLCALRSQVDTRRTPGQDRTETARAL